MIKNNFNIKSVTTENTDEEAVLRDFKEIEATLSDYGLKGTAKVFRSPLTFVINVVLGLKKLKITIKQGSRVYNFKYIILEDNCGNVKLFSRSRTFFRAIEQEIKRKNETQLLINQEMFKTYKRILKNL